MERPTRLILQNLLSGENKSLLSFSDFIYDFDHQVGWKTIVGTNLKDGIPFGIKLLRIHRDVCLSAIELIADNFLL